MIGGAGTADENGDGVQDASRARARKAPAAFRTISEVADELHIPQHVLRFWETRFPQVKPLKRGGGRRYYRPDDIALLRSIAQLLYIQGYTIKGVQRLLREGSGTLRDDIPPADEAERHESSAERVELEGLPVDEPDVPAGDAAVATAETMSRTGIGGVAVAAAAAPRRPARASLPRPRLRELLAELELLRSLLL